MSARPGQWELLGYDSDPVPGSPYDVLDEGLHYSGVAYSIQQQIIRLQQLAEPDERLQGHYADELSESCSELAEHLGKIEGRFRTTGSELRAYEDDLETARTGTKRALDDAEAAKQQMDANTPVDQPPGAEEPTQAEKDAAEARAGRYSAASGALDSARSSAHAVMSTFNERAESVARKIRDASDDDMKDSTWDKFKGAVASVAVALDFLADLAGWIATALVLVALFIPGVNVLALLAIAAWLTIGALAVHSLLAATGNGSWYDVAMDVLALATMRMGGVAVKGAQAARSVTLSRAGARAGRAASARVLQRGLVNGGRGTLADLQSLARLLRPSVRASMRTAYDDAARVLTQRPLPQVTAMQKITSGLDETIAQLRLDQQLLVRELGERAVDPAYLAHVTRARHLAVTGALADFGNKVANPKLGPVELWDVPPHEWISDKMTVTVGGPF